MWDGINNDPCKNCTIDAHMKENEQTIAQLREQLVEKKIAIQNLKSHIAWLYKKVGREKIVEWSKDEAIKTNTHKILDDVVLVDGTNK